MIEEYFDNLKELKASLNTIPTKWNHIDMMTCQLKDCLMEETERLKVTDENLTTITGIIQHCKHCIEQKAESTEAISCLTEAYRTLRNVCVQCKQNQDRLHNQADLFVVTNDLITLFIKHIKDCHENVHDSSIVTLRCIVQFLGNSVSGHTENQLLVLRTFKTALSMMLSLSDDKLKVYVSMVAYACLSNSLENTEVWIDEETVEIIRSIISFTSEMDCEWGMFLIESVCKVENGLKLILPKLTDSQSLLVLEIMLDLVKNTKEDQILPNSNMLFIKENVKSQAYKILSSLANHEDQNPIVIVKELEILGHATSLHLLYPEINNDRDLLTTIIYLLDAIHKIGKEENNPFSNVSKVTQADQIDPHHVGYALKVDLVRLIGNMAYKSKDNQDLIRELNGIPLVLDQTNIDGRNPYITQWAIFAVHNICKDSNDNKAILASLKLEGLAEDAEILRKYGIEAEVRDNKVIVKPPSENK